MVSVSALARAAALERRFGDPFDTTNPLGFKEILVCDERGDTFAAGEEALTRFGMNAELVPSAFGGRFTRLDDLVAVGKVVSRRDPGLGAGYVTSSLLAGVCVWLAGDDDQRRYVADTLMAGHRLACGYHELEHGNDFTAADFSARAVGDQLVLDGRKEVIANASRAEALVLFAATDGRRTGQAHSQLLVRRSELSGDGVVELPRFSTVGLRGVHLGGVAFRSARVDAASVLGVAGRGAENTMKTFQLTRIALPAMMTSAVDTALRCTVLHLRDRVLYGRSALELPHLRSKLVDVFATLVAADALATAAARSLHVYPGEGAVHAAVVKYCLPRLLMDAMNELAMILGAHSYLREGPTAIFQKLMRDVQAVGVVHIGKAACRMALLPQLPLLAKRSWESANAPAESLFAADADLPPLEFDRLRVTGNGRDHLFAGLRAGLADLAGLRGADADLIRRCAEPLAVEGRDLRSACTALPPAELGVDASPSAARVVDRYARLVLAGVCLQTWLHNRGSGDWVSAWAASVLGRLVQGGSPRQLPGNVEEQLFTELVSRCADNRDLTSTGRPVFGC
ncbi:acyl-CoA dehydrogenase family protein [Saccharopolyspora spinosa]|uniref:Alkylation response protein AidB-like acyl-CoA dehydrogenase n=2 Tax=Saccharopolyspora spinosa TaxID=60894 RepID=A0A2N3Y1A6_SACSN|nr:acyl-CoA dehydrogenase family protein [Saccharopolyspora spinosa]PKW16724.1 alkylation response protein AidB-like acyl-CoA dehydrogenase [Saccharopolyspora spinosa]